MKTITKVSMRCFVLYCGFIIAIAAITQSAHAQVVTAHIVVSPSTVKPDCHTYTGCGVIVEKRYYVHRYSVYHYYTHHHYRHYRHYPVVYPDASCP